MNKNKQKSYNVAVLGLLTAVTFILINTPFGTIPFGPISVTIAHLPILIATLMFGLKEGLVIALVFGLTSMARAFYAPQGVLDPLFMNPLISVLPRLMIPITTHYTYILLGKLNKYIKTSAAVIVGNLTNTFFVFLAIYLFVRPTFEAAMGMDAIPAIIAIVSSIAFFETLFAVLITVPIVLRIRVKGK